MRLRRIKSLVLCVLGAVFCGCGAEPDHSSDTSSQDPVDASSRPMHTVSEDNRIHVWIPDKPDNVTLLVSDPPGVEQELQCGRWLILVYSTLNSEDVRTAYYSGEVARQLTGAARLAIRPARDFGESRKWIPHYDGIEGIEDEIGVSIPLWLLMDDGTVTRWYCGRLTNEQVMEFAAKGLQDLPR